MSSRSTSSRVAAVAIRGRRNDSTSSQSSNTSSRQCTKPHSTGSRVGGFMSPLKSTSSYQEPDEITSQGSQGLSSRPTQEIVISQASTVSVFSNSKAVIQQVCANYLWPKMKFIDRKVDLVYNTKKRSICQKVLQQLQLPEGTDEEEWWSRHLKYVLSSMTSLRGNRASAIQKAFFGKSSSFVCDKCFVALCQLTNDSNCRLVVGNCNERKPNEWQSMVYTAIKPYRLSARP